MFVRQAINAVSLGLGVSFVAGAAVNQSTKLLTVREEHAREAWSRAQDPAGTYPGLKTVTGTRATETNADGVSRLVTAGASVAAALTAVGLLIARKPTAALGTLGVSTGLLAATMVVGRGSLTDRMHENLNVMGRAFSAWMRSTVHSSHPTVAGQMPKTEVAYEAKPSADQLRAAKLRLQPRGPHRDGIEAAVTKAYDAIDFSKRDIVIWMPSTDEHYLPAALRKGLEAAGLDGSAVMLDYPANFDFAPSVSTGMESLKELLARIAEQGGDHRVLLAGHSQGAWVIADAMENDTVHAMVDKAMLFGSPGTAVTHYTNRADPKVVEVDDKGDVLGQPVQERDALLSELRGWFNGDPSSALPLLGSAMRNPRLGAYLVAKTVDPERWKDDPHRYENFMADGAAWLVEDPAETTGRVSPMSR
ncbi:MAG: cutinase family protein [Thermoleophilia bacterium]|nr:cutinase family protein [Thermoleophilia bacterium]